MLLVFITISYILTLKACVTISYIDTDRLCHHQLYWHWQVVSPSDILTLTACATISYIDTDSLCHHQIYGHWQLVSPSAILTLTACVTISYLDTDSLCYYQLSWHWQLVSPSAVQSACLFSVNMSLHPHPMTSMKDLFQLFPTNKVTSPAVFEPMTQLKVTTTLRAIPRHDNNFAYLYVLAYGYTQVCVDVRASIRSS